MDFAVPADLQAYLDELDAFIEAEIKPLELADDNIRFFDHRREHSRTDWEEIYGPERIALLVREMRDLIATLELRTGRTFDEEKFRLLMERTNEQEGYIWEAAVAIGTARPCPVSGSSISITGSPTG